MKSKLTLVGQKTELYEDSAEINLSNNAILQAWENNEDLILEVSVKDQKMELSLELDQEQAKYLHAFLGTYLEIFK